MFMDPGLRRDDGMGQPSLSGRHAPYGGHHPRLFSASARWLGDLRAPACKPRVTIMEDATAAPSQLKALGVVLATLLVALPAMILLYRWAIGS